MLSRSDRMVLVARRIAHALKMSLLVTGVAVGSAALWYVVNAPDGSATTALLGDLKAGPVYVNTLGVEDWQVICLVSIEENPNAWLASAGANQVKNCEGWNGSMKYFSGFSTIALSGPNSCQITPLLAEHLTAAIPGESRCEQRTGLMSLELKGASLPYGLELRRN